MLIFFALYLLIILWGVRFCKTRSDAYLDMDHTQAIKGIFILLVFFHHFNSYVTYSGRPDQIYKGIVDSFEQTMVTLFLFYSGYGVMESIRKKKAAYTNSIPGKRVLSTLIRFDCAIAIFAIVKLLLGKWYTPTHYLLSLIGWESLGNSNWYIFDIMALYLLTFAAFKLANWGNKERPLLAAVLLLLAVVAIIFAVTTFRIKELWWYDTILCYVLGILYSQFRCKIEKLLNRNLLTWALSMVIVWALYVIFKLNRLNDWFIIARNLFFCLAVLITTMRVCFKNKVLVWCGKHLFEVYILQRIPMIILRHLGLGEFNIYLYFVASAICTFVLVYPFKKLTDWAVKLPSLLVRKKTDTRQ